MTCRSQFSPSFMQVLREELRFLRLIQHMSFTHWTISPAPSYYSLQDLAVLPWLTLNFCPPTLASQVLGLQTAAFTLELHFKEFSHASRAIREIHIIWMLAQRSPEAWLESLNLYLVRDCCQPAKSCLPAIPLLLNRKLYGCWWSPWKWLSTVHAFYLFFGV